MSKQDISEIFQSQFRQIIWREVEEQTKEGFLHRLNVLNNNNEFPILGEITYCTTLANNLPLFPDAVFLSPQNNIQLDYYGTPDAGWYTTFEISGEKIYQYI